MKRGRALDGRARERSEGARLLVELGLSCAEIATRLGVSKSTVGHWLTGRKLPGQALRVALEREFPSVPASAWPAKRTSAERLAAALEPATGRLAQAITRHLDQHLERVVAELEARRASPARDEAAVDEAARVAAEELRADARVLEVLGELARLLREPVDELLAAIAVAVARGRRLDAEARERVRGMLGSDARAPRGHDARPPDAPARGAGRGHDTRSGAARRDAQRDLQLDVGHSTADAGGAARARGALRDPAGRVGSAVADDDDEDDDAAELDPYAGAWEPEP